MSGSQSVDQLGVYGTQGVYNTLNQPGSRDSHQLVFDNAHSLFLMGGQGYGTSFSDGSTVYGYLNDLWMYDMTLNQ
jgi:hypothetical protein